MIIATCTRAASVDESSCSLSCEKPYVFIEADTGASQPRFRYRGGHKKCMLRVRPLIPSTVQGQYSPHRLMFVSDAQSKDPA